MIARSFLLNFRRCFHISKSELPINEEIREKEVRVITNEGEQLGILSIEDALKAAEARDLDLVEIAPNSQPPVCKIMDYGKFLYERTKKEKESKKKRCGGVRAPPLLFDIVWRELFFTIHPNSLSHKHGSAFPTGFIDIFLHAFIAYIHLTETC